MTAKFKYSLVVCRVSMKWYQLYGNFEDSGQKQSRDQAADLKFAVSKAHTHTNAPPHTPLHPPHTHTRNWLLQ